ncbi:MAG: DUF6174 domain-containing protein [Anaerolineales bacterium]|jgi:hypothetical protein|nr:DUF6174 domain-containing protein [Anaerolineales bacterium]
MKKIIPFALVLILVACSAAAPSEYDQNLKKWQDSNIAHYRYTLFLGCFCIFENDMPLTVEVKDGEVVSVTRSDGTIVNPSDSFYEFYEPYITMDRILLELETVLSSEADDVAVTYDPAYGYPANIAIDYIKEAIDDELSIQVSDFVVLE